MEYKNKKFIRLLLFSVVFSLSLFNLPASASECTDNGGHCESTIGEPTNNLQCNDPAGTQGITTSLGLGCGKDMMCCTPVSQAAPSSESAPTGYIPMEEIPGFGRPDNFVDYVLAVYKFGIWGIGLAAMLMIMIGGYMYITSAGNASAMGKAKKVITDAIVGIVLAMASWLLLFTINPALVSISITSGYPIGAAGEPGTSRGPGGTTDGYKKACPNTSSTAPIDYSQAKTDDGIQLNRACDRYDALFRKYGIDGVDPCLLRSIAQLESSCGANKGPSSAGACGLMQLLPGTAGVSCDELMRNDELSVQKAAEYIRKNRGAVGSAKNPVSAIFGGYNSGYGCPPGDKHALCQSSDCQEALAFECCINPGGLDQSINYAWNGIGLYEKCKAL